jgi:signal transduction histidine kinase
VHVYSIGDSQKPELPLSDPPSALLSLDAVCFEASHFLRYNPFRFGHARSPSAEVRLNFEGERVSMRIQDQGVGIPAEALRSFKTDGTQVGVGLVGMRQRAQEQNGTFSLSSNSHGTTITVQLPIIPDVEGRP